MKSINKILKENSSYDQMIYYKSSDWDEFVETLGKKLLHGPYSKMVFFLNKRLDQISALVQKIEMAGYTKVQIELGTNPSQDNLVFLFTNYPRKK